MSRKATYRRSNKRVRVESAYWHCAACRTDTGPFRFIDQTLEEENDSEASRVWQDKFNEPMPPPVVGARIRKIMRTEEGRKAVAKAFGRAIEKKISKEKL